MNILTMNNVNENTDELLNAGKFRDRWPKGLEKVLMVDLGLAHWVIARLQKAGRQRSVVSSCPPIWSVQASLRMGSPLIPCFFNFSKTCSSVTFLPWWVQQSLTTKSSPCSSLTCRHSVACPRINWLKKWCRWQNNFWYQHRWLQGVTMVIGEQCQSRWMSGRTQGLQVAQKWGNKGQR